MKDQLVEERPTRPIREPPRPRHEDGLGLLNSGARLEHKLEAIQQALLKFVPPIDRIAVVTYDPATDMLKTYLSCGRKAGLKYYDAKLGESASLARNTSDIRCKDFRR